MTNRFLEMNEELRRISGRAARKGGAKQPEAPSPVLPRSMSESDSSGGGPINGVSADGVEFVKQWEGFVPRLYNDPVGHCTVGYGALVHQGNCDGRESEQPYVNGISKQDATRLLMNELTNTLRVVSSAVKVALNQNQSDALVSFAFNVGTANFQGSTLLSLLNQGNYAAVPGELKKWTKARDGGKLVELPGLVRRRAAEADLFQKPVASGSQSLLVPVGASRPLSQSGIAMPARHSYRYHSPSTWVSPQSTYSIAQNPGVVIIAGMEVGDALQVGLGAIAVIQAQVSASQGSFSLAYDKAQRLLTSEARAQMPGSQSTKKSYSLDLLFVGSEGLVGERAYARVIIEWEGNPYGEISTPIMRRDLAQSSEWSKSSNNTTITKVDRIPLPQTDPRAWPIVYTYEGTFDPVGNGYFEYSGEFEVNAFGGLKFNRHEVVSRSLADWAVSGGPEDYVRKGKDVVVAGPAIPKEQVDYLRTKLP